MFFHDLDDTEECCSGIRANRGCPSISAWQMLLGASRCSYRSGEQGKNTPVGKTPVPTPLWGCDKDAVRSAWKQSCASNECLVPKEPSTLLEPHFYRMPLLGVSCPAEASRRRVDDRGHTFPTGPMSAELWGTEMNKQKSGWATVALGNASLHRWLSEHQPIFCPLSLPAAPGPWLTVHTYVFSGTRGSRCGPPGSAWELGLQEQENSSH